jgi:two-component system sensor histidine kinase QseC
MKSIRRRIVLTLSTSVLLVCAAVFVTVYVVVRHQLLSQADTALSARAELVAGALKIEGDHYYLESSTENFPEFARRERPSYLEVRDSTGHIRLRSISLANASLPVPESDLAATQTPVARLITLPDGRRGQLLTIRHRLDKDADADEEHGSRKSVPTSTIYVSVAGDMADGESTLGWLATALAVAFGLVVMALLGLVPGIVGAGLRPLRAMSDRVAALDARSLSQAQFTSADLPSELTAIAAQLDSSLRRIGEAFHRERRFASHAAHELRTPLAAVRANAEVALRWPDLERMRGSMRDVLISAERMQGLVDRLLELARLGGEIRSLPKTALDLATLLEDALQTIDEQCAARGITIRREFSTPIPVSSSPSLLPSVLDNVLSNAARYATPNSEIVVTVRGDERVMLSVENATSDLKPGDLDRMFEPLWTKSTDRSTGSAGLGLALVAEYARVLDLTVTPLLDSGTNRFSLSVAFPPLCATSDAGLVRPTADEKSKATCTAPATQAET